MPEVIRSVVSRVRVFFKIGDSRHGCKCVCHLPFQFIARAN